jgi:uncharacterized SAM-binding protein YcdF (DUF218 family)
MVALVIVLTLLGADLRLFVWPPRATWTRSDAVVVLGGLASLDRLRAAQNWIAAHPGETLVVSTGITAACPQNATGAAAIVCFRPDPFTTRGEARFAARLAAERGWHSLVVVVTADQQIRAQLRFRRCWAGQLTVVDGPNQLGSRLWKLPYQTAAMVKAEVWQRGC